MYRTLHEAQVWKLGGNSRRFDPQTVGRKRTLLNRIINPGTVKVDELSRAIEQWEERARSYQYRAREKISDGVRSGILTGMCPEHFKIHIHFNPFVCQITPLFARKSKRSLKPDSRVRIPMRWTLAVSMGRKVCVAIVDSEDIGQQSVPNVARMVKEAKVRMTRDRARKASQAKGKLMIGKEKAQVASGKHARHLKVLQSLLEMASHGRGLFHVGKN